MTTLYKLAQEEMAILDALERDGGDVEGPNVTEALKAYWCEDEIHQIADMRADLVDDEDTPPNEKFAHEEHFDRAMAEIGERIEKKVDGYLMLIRNVEAQQMAREQEAKRMADLARTDANLVNRLKMALQFAMEATGRRKIETEHGKAWVQKNGGRRPVILADNITVQDVPEEFRRIAVDFDRAAMYQVLEHGGTLPFATLGDPGYSLRVK